MDDDRLVFGYDMILKTTHSQMENAWKMQTNLLVKSTDFGIVSGPTSQTYSVGDDAAFTCVVKASDVSPTMRWYKSVDGRNRLSVADEKSNLFQTSSLYAAATMTLKSWV